MRPQSILFVSAGLALFCFLGGDRATAQEQAAKEKYENAASPLDAARCAAEKAAAEKVAAEKRVAEKTAAATAAEKKAADTKAAADKAASTAKDAAEAAAAAKAAADKAVLDRANADKAAAAMKEAADKAAAERAAAEKALAEKQAAAEKADAAVRAQELWDADKAVAKIKTDRANAEKSLREGKATAAEKAAADAETTELDQAIARATAALPAAIERAARARAAAIGGLKPLAADAWSYQKARHLLFRAGLGGPPEEVAKLHQMGLFAAVDYLVDYHLQQDSAAWFDAFPHRRVAPYEQYLNEAQRAELNSARVSFRWDQHHRLRRWWLQRLVETQRPLQEKLTLFWHGHFACSYLAAEDSYAMWQQNQMFRRRAAGNFGALLRGIAQDPAMIRYLDNHVNFEDSGNENLGREILELFSMGEGQGYSEEDLAQAARALSGYNFEYHNGKFKFIASRHDTGEKTLFGHKGHFGGDELVDLILQQPATARYISAKLFRFFAHEEPEADIVERLAHVLRSHQYELQPILQNLFLSEEFYSERAMGNHIKSPVELVIGTIRTLKLAEVNYGAVDSAVTDMGQRLFEPPNVAGWEGGKAWINANTLLLRYNAVASLVEQADLFTALENGGIREPAAAVDYLARTFLAVPLSSQKREELIAYLGALPPPDQWAAQRNEINQRLRAVLVAMTSLPEYQVAQISPHTDPTGTPWTLASNR